LFIGKRHKRGRGFGLSVFAYQSTGHRGLYNLNGTVIAPRANKPWREKPNAGGERRRQAVCGGTACTVWGGGGRKENELGRDTRGRTTDRETGGTKALGPTVKHHLPSSSRPDPQPRPSPASSPAVIRRRSSSGSSLACIVAGRH